MDHKGQESTMFPLRHRNFKALKKTVFPALRSLIDLGYFSLSVEGAEHVPRSGPVVYAGNHAGWFTIDSFFAALAVADHVSFDRIPWVAGQDQMLMIPELGPFFADSGVFPSSWLRKPEALPPGMDVLCVFPEGTEGNCKSFVHAYQMREWKTGFLRLALARGAKVLPAAILGSEECLPSIAPIRFLKPIVGTILPLPLSLIPLPSRWKFIFHEPVDVQGALPGFESDDPETQKRRLRDLAASIRETVQRTLDREAADRGLVRLSKLLKPSG
ncbi:lysophospholipid acyltransferase family protein [Sorangium sp. So ce118]